MIYIYIYIYIIHKNEKLDVMPLEASQKCLGLQTPSRVETEDFISLITKNNTQISNISRLNILNRLLSLSKVY